MMVTMILALSVYRRIEQVVLMAHDRCPFSSWCRVLPALSVCLLINVCLNAAVEHADSGILATSV